MALSSKQHKCCRYNVKKNVLRQGEATKTEYPVYGRVKRKDKSLHMEVLHGGVPLFDNQRKPVALKFSGR